MGSWIELIASDGHAFKAWEAAPEGTPRGVVVVAPEIFGINSHIRSVADGYAADGYLAIAPALFDRAQRDYEAGYTQADVQAGVALMQKLSSDNALLDIAAVVNQSRPAGKVGIVGYCWGGTLAWLAAARLQGVDAAVAYYGGGIPGLMDEQPKIPLILHFGEQDTHPSLEQAREIAARHPSLPAYFYPAGHGFNCSDRGSFDEASSRLARERTLTFFAQHLAS